MAEGEGREAAPKKNAKPTLGEGHGQLNHESQRVLHDREHVNKGRKEVPATGLQA